jgi:hypothetical protein
MLYALCSMRVYVWKVFFVQIVAVSIPFNRPDGDAIAVPFSTSNLNPSSRFKRF